MVESQYRWRALRSGLLASCGLAVLLGAGPALAQDAATIDEVVVTAQKRDQSIQDVPIAMSAYGSRALERAHITEVNDLQKLAPGVTMQTTQSEATASTIRIRGVGTTGNNPGLEGAVGVFVDGVYRSRAGLVMNDLFDIGQVEVLRGPQGTLFGKNTSAGAITIQSNAPTFDAGGELEGSYGNYDAVLLKGMANLPLSDIAAVRISGAYDRRDGFLNNLSGGDDINDRDRYLARAQFRLTPDADTDWRVIADYAHKDEKCCAAGVLVPGPTVPLLQSLGGTFITPADPFGGDIRVDAPFVERSTDKGVTSIFKRAFGDTKFTNITAYRRFGSFNTSDVDFTDVSLATQSTKTNAKFFSTEFQLNGKVGIVDWLVGAYYFDERIATHAEILAGSQLGSFLALRFPTLGSTLVARGLGATPAAALAKGYPAGSGSISDFAQRAEGWALFTHNTIQWTPELSTTFGLRYTSEEKTGSGVLASTTPVCAVTLPAALATAAFQCPRPGFLIKRDADAFSGTANIAYKISSDVNAYASYSHGFKAGGINLDRDAAASIPPALTFQPETVDSYELGVKSVWLQHTLVVNAATYYAKFKDFQLNAFNGVGFSISNAGGVISQGAEIEAQWSPVAMFSTTLAAAWNQSEYTNSTTLPCQRPPAGVGLGTPTSTCAGLRITNAPRWILTNGYELRGDLPSMGLGWFADASINYRSGYNTGADLDEPKYQGGFAVVDGRIGITRADGWEVYAWGKNLFNHPYRVVASDAFLQPNTFTSFIGAPATYGVAVKAKF